ncbi:MAG: carbamate kinase [Candidatus Nanopelagicales bacterium]|nr:carbamate kinase [Candidatus Nanopelagicales bacterium]
MRVVIALGGNALQRRGEPMTVQRQRENVRVACRAIAPIAAEHELVISHGNGPQVGLLALQAAAYDEQSAYPFDVLGAQTEGMIGYLIEQELGNLLPEEQHLATILTMTEVDPADPAFADPTKFVGPVYDASQARRLAEERGWTVKPDGAGWRRVVPSPAPKRIFEIQPIRWLLEHGVVVVCTGGGGIPTMYLPDEGYVGGTRTLVGVEAVIDKDWASALLAESLGADLLVVATDVDAVQLDWGTPAARTIRAASPEAADGLDLPAGSMGPKVAAAAAFARSAPHRAAIIGSLADLSGIMAGRAGTRIAQDVPGLVLADGAAAAEG